MILRSINGSHNSEAYCDGGGTFTILRQSRLQSRSANTAPTRDTPPHPDDCPPDGLRAAPRGAKTGEVATEQQVRQLRSGRTNSPDGLKPSQRRILVAMN